MKNTRASAEHGRARMRVPRLHLVTDDDVIARADFPETAARVLAFGGPSVALHVRAPGAGGAVLERLVLRLLVDAREAGALLLVNDRLDVALGLGADGAHLGRRSIPVGAARTLLGSGALVGVSVHGAAEAGRARDGGADFAFLGAIYDTPSHPEGTPMRPEAIVEARATAPGLPLLAIGGVTETRVPEVVERGAFGVAVLSGVWKSPEPVAATGRYLDALRAAKGSGDGQQPE